MPTYEYVCRACGHGFELFQSMSEGAKRTCPECRKPKLERLIGTGAGFLFKGSGFYQTDYRSDSYREGAKAESSGGESSTDSTGDTSGGESSGSGSGDAKEAG